MLTVEWTFALEQTLDQFFKLNLPMRVPQLKGLTNGFDNALQQYTNRVVAQLGNTFLLLHAIIWLALSSRLELSVLMFVPGSC